MVEFIRIQYRLGRLTAEQVCFMAPKWITADQAEEIIHPRLTNEGAALTQALFDHYKALVELRRAGRYAEAVELMRGAVEAESNGLCDDDE